MSRAGELGHRDQNPLIKSNDSDFPEPGQNEEHSGEKSGENELQRDSGCKTLNRSAAADRSRGPKRSQRKGS